MLDVKRLRVPREVAAQGSFSGAADALAYTQSAVSQQISALEREAGVTLVERNARGVRLTDAGDALVRHAGVILARLADAEAELEAIAGLRGGRLRLVAIASCGATILPRAIARFRERHPGVELTMEPGEPEDAVAALRAGECDLAVTVDDTLGSSPGEGIERTHLLDDPMYVVLPAGHALAHKRRLRLQDLSGEAWINGSTSATCPDGRILIRACNKAGFEPRVVFASDDYNAVQGFIAAGVGISLIPDLGLISVRDDVVVRSLGPDAPKRRIIASSLSDGYCSPAKHAMLDILVEVGKEFAGRRRELALVS